MSISPDILGVKFGASGSKVLVYSASSKLLFSLRYSYIVSVWSPFVTMIFFPRTRTGEYIISEGSLKRLSSKAFVIISSLLTSNTLFLELVLLPMIKYANTTLLSSDLPNMIPLPGYSLAAR